MTGKGSSFALFKKVISNRRHDHSLESELEWFLLPWIPEHTLDPHVAACVTKTLQPKICMDCSATSIFLSYGLLVINHYFPLYKNFKVATVAWYYPRLLSSPFFFFWGGGYLNLCPPSLIPLSQSMTPSKGWQNKKRPLSITLGCAEMSSGLCLLKLRGLHEWWWDTTAGLSVPRK